MRWTWLALLLLAANVLAGHPEPVDDRQAATRVLGSMAERLALMPAVAAWKWQHGVAVRAPEREAQVLANAREAAARLGLDPDSVVPLVETQMAAARAVQELLHRQWHQGVTAPEQAPDLAGELRPALNRLGEAQLRELALGLPALQTLDAPPTRFVRALAALGLDASWAPRLLATARQVDYAAVLQVLAAVQARGVLRVATTLDYAPFSYRDRVGQPAGIDLDLAAALAQHLGVELRLVPTSWPTLTADFRAGRAELVLSGVTRTAARAQHGLFTRAYHQGGKAVVARCAIAPALAGMADLDHPQRTLVVNPGGTNQRWVDANIRQARVRVHPDNTTIFSFLAAGGADAMVTDAIEVRLQVAHHRGRLCPGLGGALLTRTSKGGWLPPDPAWQSAVDAFLGAVAADGRLDAMFRRHLEGTASAGG